MSCTLRFFGEHFQRRTMTHVTRIEVPTFHVILLTYWNISLKSYWIARNDNRKGIHARRRLRIPVSVLIRWFFHTSASFVLQCEIIMIYFMNIVLSYVLNVVRKIDKLNVISWLWLIFDCSTNSMCSYTITLIVHYVIWLDGRPRHR